MSCAPTTRSSPSRSRSSRGIEMADTSFIAWPFFEDSHRGHFDALSLWCETHAHELHEKSGDVEAECRRLVKMLGGAGWFRAAVPAAYGGLNEKIDVRTLCLTRMTLGYHAALADFAFAMQGLGTGAISLFGSEAVKQAYLPRIATGDMISGFALSEKKAGSDVAAMDTSATKVDGGWIINGEKTWISNGAIADVLTLFARSGEAPGAKGLSAFVFPTATEGFSVTERIDVIAPHPLATIRLDRKRTRLKSSH